MFKTLIIYLAAFMLPLTVQARWISVDPKASKYPSVTPYAYTLNNPVRLFDPDGQAPGDPFVNQNAAAQDFGMIYNDDAIRRDREYFTGIYTFQDGGRQIYTYEKPTVGNQHSVTPVYRRDYRQYTAAAHTHRADNPGYDDNNFSGADKNYATNGKYIAHVNRFPSAGLGGLLAVPHIALEGSIRDLYRVFGWGNPPGVAVAPFDYPRWAFTDYSRYGYTTYNPRY